MSNEEQPDYKDPKWRQKRLYDLGWRPDEEANKQHADMVEFAKLQELPEEKKMSREEGSDKGKNILALMADLYQQIEWEGEDEDGDPYLKMTFYKSGKFTIETYKDNEVAEFTIDEIVK